MDNAAEESDADKEIRSDKDYEKIMKIISMKDMTARDATDRIASSCDNILVFLQAVAFKKKCKFRRH